VLRSSGADEEEGPQPGQSWCFVGMTGTGKSTKEKALMRHWLAKGRPVVGWDVDDELSQQGKRRDGVTLGPLRDRLTFSQLLQNPRVLTAADLSLAVVPEDPEEQPVAVAEQFLDFSKYVKGRGDCILVLAELGYWGMAMPAVEARLAVIATKWRKEGIALSADMQFLTQAPVGFRSQMTRVYAFRQAKKSHLVLLAQETTPAFARQVRRLKKYQCLVTDVWDDPADDDELLKAA
jgi:hypothetical protein